MTPQGCVHSQPTTMHRRLANLRLPLRSGVLTTALKAFEKLEDKFFWSSKSFMLFGRRLPSTPKLLSGGRAKQGVGGNTSGTPERIGWEGWEAINCLQEPSLNHFWILVLVFGSIYSPSTVLKITSITIAKARRGEKDRTKNSFFEETGKRDVQVSEEIGTTFLHSIIIMSQGGKTMDQQV
jgi:hypothetical protein